MAYSDIDFFGKGKTYDFWKVLVANMCQVASTWQGTSFEYTK
jgi:hypothetical protein